MIACRRVRATPLLVALIVLGCGNPLSPEHVVGTYALDHRTLDGVWFHGVDTIRLSDDRTGTIFGWSDTEPFRWSRPIHFRVVDSRIEMEFSCPANALCAPPPHYVARPVPGGLRMERMFDTRTRLHYPRVPPSP